jgi:predicted CXXCH cytochrome family protein
VAAANNGSSALNADGCAGCHRAHTAQGPHLLAEATVEDLCLSCHGSAGVGASTDVEMGVQFKLKNPVGGSPQDASGTAVLGALRGGGFVSARINTGNPTRAGYTTSSTVPANSSFDGRVGVLAAGAPVTSAHLKLGGASGVTLKNIAWGNDSTTGSGPTVTISCTSCHNPHGNGQYRILQLPPNLAVETGTIHVTDASGGTVTDDSANTSIVSSVGGTDTRNYTVIQATASGGRYLLASQIITDESAGTFTNLAGDYFHRKVPWTYTGSSSNSAYWDGPNGLPATFDVQINAWCLQCHSRYVSDSGSTAHPTDSPFTYRHANVTVAKPSNKPCTTCHVAHGTNATMTGFYTSNYPYPDTTTSDSSRLLKVDNRGTCQLCHDPTSSIKASSATLGNPSNPWTGPTPAPLIP